MENPVEIDILIKTFDDLPIGVGIFKVLDLESIDDIQYVFMNKVVLAEMQKDKEEVFGKKIKEVAPEAYEHEGGRYVMDTYRRIAKEGGSVDLGLVEYSNHLVAGTYHCSIHHIKDNYVYILLRNVTELEQTKSELEKSNKELTAANLELEKAANTNSKYSKIFRSNKTGVLIIDKNSNIVECNEAVGRVFNYTVKELVGSHLDKILPDFIKGEKHQANVDKYRKAPSSRPMKHDFEFKGLDKDGNEILLDIKLNFFHEGDEMYSVAFIEDITDKLRIEAMHKEAQELMAKNKLAEAAAQNKQQFLANMSHEIRTPMNGIVGLVDILDQDENLSEQQKNYISTIKTSSLSLMNVINDILDLSKLEEGRMKLTEQNFNLHTSLKSIQNLYSSKALEKALTYEFNIDERVPENVIGDEHRLKQVLSNVLSNAIKFTDKGSVTVNTLLKEQTNDKSIIRFEVKDTGIGIDIKDKERLFEQYEQADSSLNKQYAGTGLGLGISKRLVELMDGEINFESELGKGSCFIIELPLKTSQDSAPKLDENHSTQNIDQKLRVLLVDDKKINITITKLMLAKMGINPSIAANGLEAIEAVKSQEFDIVLMDIQMPVLNGLDATIKIKQEKLSEAHIIALTANAMEGDKENYLANGFDGYLPKPITLETLKEALSKVSE